MYNKEPDEQAVCRFILKQLRDGKIKFCVQAPQAVQVCLPPNLSLSNGDVTFFDEYSPFKTIRSV